MIGRSQLWHQIPAALIAGLFIRVHGGDVPASESVSSQPGPVATGRQLFLMNCAHCHGADARGDEGPDLHGVVKSDQRIKSMILDGVKGEMPKFGVKLSTNDVAALIKYIRSLD